MHTGEWHKLCACVPGWATLQRREALHDESEREEAYAGTAIDRAAVGDDPNTARFPASHRRTSSCHDDDKQNHQ